VFDVVKVNVLGSLVVPFSCRRDSEDYKAALNKLRGYFASFGGVGEAVEDRLGKVVGLK
jgi:hypothetical protein